MLGKLNLQEGAPLTKRLSHNLTAVNLHQPKTAEDIINLEKSPPKISSVRKRMMLINDTVMGQFGNDAFRLKTQKPNQKSLSPKRESPHKNLLGKQNFMTNSTDRDVDRNKLFLSLNDVGD